MKHLDKIKVWLWLSLVLTVTLAGFSQKSNPNVAARFEVKDYQLNSRLMARQMPYRVISPKIGQVKKSSPTNSIKAGKQPLPQNYPVIYLLHGLTGHFSDWVDRAKIAEYAERHNYIIVMPEGDNGWYTDSASVANDKYESYIIQELMPEIEKNFSTIADRNHRFIAGLSMGGYGSLKFGLKYPEKFALVGSFSGALGAASWTDKTLGNGWKALTNSIMSVYGAEDSQTRKDNDIFKLVRETSPDKMKNLPFFYIDCGTEDGLVKANRDFAGLLLEKKIPHEFRELPGKHDWVFWDAQVQEFLRLSDKILLKSNANAN